jgi:hypothetical protein
MVVSKRDQVRTNSTKKFEIINYPSIETSNCNAYQKSGLLINSGGRILGKVISFQCFIKMPFIF